MNSLSDLNKASKRVFLFADTRPIGVSFDKVSPENQVSIDTSNGYKILYPGINFTAIINGGGYFVDIDSDGNKTYTTGTVLTTGFMYSVTLPISGTISDPSDLIAPAAALSFGGFPNPIDGRLERLKNIGSGSMYIGYSVNNSPNYSSATYTVYGIKSLADWNAVKNVYTTVSSGTVTSKIISTYSTLTWTTTFGSGGSTKPWPEQDWPATTGTVKYATVNRQVFVNKTLQMLFDTYTPVLQDTAGGTPSYSINLTTSAGQIGKTAGDKSNNYTFSGTKTTINSDFYNIKFWPVTDLVGNKTITMKVYRDSILIDQQIVPLEILPVSNTQLSSVSVIPTTQTIVPPSNSVYYDIILIGGGAGGGKPSTAAGGGGGGGGAGQVYAHVGQPVSGNLLVKIGAGGHGDNTSTVSVDGGNGFSSNVTVNSTVIFTANGGYGGGGGIPSRSGGPSGSTNSVGTASAGGYWSHLGGATNLYGGGGGGAKTVGTNGTATESVNSGGQGINSSDFYLIGYVGGDIGVGGSGGRAGGTGSGYGSGGNGGWGTTASGAGTNGIAVIKFY